MTETTMPRGRLATLASELLDDALEKLRDLNSSICQPPLSDEQLHDILADVLQLTMMNAYSKAFWKVRSDDFIKRIEKRPTELSVAADMHQRQLQRLNAALGPDAGTVAVSVSQNIEDIVADLAAAQSEEQRRRRKKNPNSKPRKLSTAQCALRCVLKDKPSLQPNELVDWLRTESRTYDDEDIEIGLKDKLTGEIFVRNLATNGETTIKRSSLRENLKRARKPRKGDAA